jgi:DNA-binding MarR family transcriptional regulator
MKTPAIPLHPRLTARQQPNVGTLLLLAYRRFNRELFSALAGAGHPSLKPKHGAVLANLDAGGSRSTELAARAGMTKPAMGELINELESLGYVRRIADPHDRRAKLVAPTPCGASAIVLAAQMLARIEARWQRQLGKDPYQEMIRALELICR